MTRVTLVIALGAAVALGMWWLRFEAANIALVGAAILALGGFTNIGGVALRRWPDTPGKRTGGYRTEVSQLTYGLTTGRRDVSDYALRQLRDLAEMRLARHGVDVTDTPAVRRLLGESCSRLLAQTTFARPSTRLVAQCIARLEELGPAPTPTSHRQR